MGNRKHEKHKEQVTQDAYTMYAEQTAASSMTCVRIREGNSKKNWIRFAQKKSKKNIGVWFKKISVCTALSKDNEDR